jgi:hypothetical protein
VRYFDYQSVAREAKIPDRKLRKLVELIGKEFPNDSMMAELTHCELAKPYVTVTSR